MKPEDKFKPPSAEVQDPPRKRGTLLRALLTGTVIEIVGTLAVGLLAGLVYGLVLGVQGYGKDQVEQILTNPDPLSGFGLVGSLLGSAVSVFAGFACASIAPGASYRPLLMLSAISVSLGLLVSADTYAWHVSLVYSLLTLACVGFGGWLHLKDRGASA